MKLKFKALRGRDHQRIIAPQEQIEEEEEKTLYGAPDSSKLHMMIQALDHKIVLCQQQIHSGARLERIEKAL